MSGVEAALWFRLRVERGAEIVPEAAPLDEKLPKLCCERREHLGKEESFFWLLVHRISPNP